VLTETQRRGSTATGRRDFWGSRPERLWPLVAALVAALALHLPILPTKASVWIRMLFEKKAVVDDGPQQEIVLPIDLDLAEPEPPKRDPDAEPSSQPRASANEGRASLDGANDGDVDLDAASEAGAGTAPPPPAPEPEPPAPLVETKEPEGAAPPKPPEPAREALPEPAALPDGDLADPFEAAGDVGRLRAEEPNVNIYLAGDVLRTRALSEDFGALLTSVPQWQALLGGTGIDPMKHFDHVLISGPQMRDPQWIVVTVQYNLPSDRMKKAVDEIVARTKRGSQWLEGYDVPVAVLGGKPKRFVVLVPDKRLLVVLPEEAEKLISRVAGLPGFAKSPGAGIVVDMIEPYKAFQAAPFQFPRSIGRMRLHFTLAGSEDYVVAAEAWDASPAEASEHAIFLKQRIDAFEIDLGAVGRLLGTDKIRAVGDTSFDARGSKIHARAAVSHKQLKRIIGFIQSWLDARAEDAKAEAEKAKEAREKQIEAKKKLAEARKKLLEAKKKRAEAKKQRSDAAEAEIPKPRPPPDAPSPAPPPAPAESTSAPAEP
jgi:hypothetical protein